MGIQSRNKFLRNLLFIGLYVALSVCCVSIKASNTSYAIDSNAEKIIGQMQLAYSSLNSLSEQITSAESSELPYSIVLHTTLRVLRPGYVSVVTDSKSSRSGATEVVTDGSHCYVTEPQYPARYLKFEVPDSEDALKTALSHGVTSGLTLDLFSDPSAAASMFAERRLATLQVAKSVKINGVSTRVVVATDIDGATVTLFIDQGDHLLRRAIAVDPNKAGTFTETYTSILVNPPLTTSDFVFKAPVGHAPFYGTSFNQAIQDPPN